jgi:integrase/recombinase XerD
MGGDEGILFLTRLGGAITPDTLTERVKKYVDASKVGKRGACHLFRHTMATLMLEGGADVRYVQEMLGHTKLETTQIYTQVSITKLREVHAATHPGAKLGRNAPLAKTAANADDVAELLSSLAAEAAEEGAAASSPFPAGPPPRTGVTRRASRSACAQARARRAPP